MHEDKYKEVVKKLYLTGCITEGEAETLADEIMKIAENKQANVDELLNVFIHMLHGNR